MFSQSEGGVEWLERGKIYEGQENLYSSRTSSDPSWVDNNDNQQFLITNCWNWNKVLVLLICEHINILHRNFNISWIKKTKSWKFGSKEKRTGLPRQNAGKTDQQCLNWFAKLFWREKKKEKLNTLLGKAEQLERFNNDLRQECYRLWWN